MRGRRQTQDSGVEEADTVNVNEANETRDTLGVGEAGIIDSPHRRSGDDSAWGV